MSRTIVQGNATAGNGSFVTVYQSAATASTVLGNVTAYNNGSGSETITLQIVKANGTAVIVAVAAIAGKATQSFGPASASGICPLALLPGEKLQGSGTGADITVNASGASFT